ncbi:MAG: hypothetical protein SVR94_08445 [Pseudomonadota bacterium]|nr:hypothetical protein [Pseudomonadota bacterium]
MSAIDYQVEQCLEYCCQQGCQWVNEFIQKLEQGLLPLEVRHLTPAQRILLLEELQSIMAVYAQTKSCVLNK